MYKRQGLLLLQGLGCYLIAVWLLRPLGRLSRASRRIAGGNLEVRAKVETGQEKIERWNEVDGNLDNGEKLQAFLDSTTDAYAILQDVYKRQTVICVDWTSSRNRG